MTSKILVRAAVAVAFCGFTAASLAQPAQTDSGFKPSVGQQGKDVVWVPTPQELVDKMLDLAKVSATDYVIDLGSGDGRTVITAAKRGATAIGIEYNPDMVELSRKNAAAAGVDGRATFERADLFTKDLSKATVITMFLLPDINLKLRPKILDLKPGTHIVSNTFTMGDWQPDESVTLDTSTGCRSWCTALHWIVPAKVGGTHKTSAGELTLKQSFQMLSGTLRTGGQTVPVEGKVVGNEVQLTAAGRSLHFMANGNRLEAH